MAASSSSSRLKVCLFSSCVPVSFAQHEVIEDVYIFDLDPDTNRNPNPIPNLDPDLISVAPVLRYVSPYPVARCVRNSTLYLFEGSANAEPNEKSLRIYDFSSSSSSSSIKPESKPVKIVDLETRSPMNGLKMFPSAILTPDGEKILVFSGVIRQFDPYDGDLPNGLDRYINFELYDFVNDKWVELPPLPDLPRSICEKSFYIQSYYFADESTFVICTEDLYLFALHLNGDDATAYWESKTYFDNRMPLRGEICSLGFGDVYVSRSHFYDKSKRFFLVDLPKSPNAPNAGGIMEDRYGPAMAVMDRRHGYEEDDGAVVCVIHRQFDESRAPIMSRDNTTTYPRVYIDVHELNPASALPLDKTTTIKMTLTPTKTRSYKFAISLPYMFFGLDALLPVVVSGSKSSV